MVFYLHFLVDTNNYKIPNTDLTKSYSGAQNTKEEEACRNAITQESNKPARQGSGLKRSTHALPVCEAIGINNNKAKLVLFFNEHNLEIVQLFPMK